MIPSAETLNRFAETWAALVGGMLWQSTILALAVAAVGLRLRDSSPGVRYWLWQIVALKLLILPFWALAVPLPEFLGSSFSPEPAAPANAGPGGLITFAVPESDEHASSPAAWSLPHRSVGESRPAFQELTLWSWLFLLWLVLVLAGTVRLGRQRLLLGRLLRAATKQTDSTLVEQLSALASRLGLRRVPTLLTTERDVSPFVCGLRRPLLIVPRPLLTALSAEQLEQVLLHELAHVRRGDLLWSWLPELARLFWFFHPVAHWASGHIRLERELACDQLAMTLSKRNAADYAGVLVQVVSHTSVPAALRPAGAAFLALDGSGLPGSAQPTQEESRT
jgi:beta-lactamase regulating signal transducer with metallopeptidase domain